MFAFRHGNVPVSKIPQFKNAAKMSTRILKRFLWGRFFSNTSQCCPVVPQGCQDSGKKAVEAAASGKYKKYQRIFLLVSLPLILLQSAYCYYEHEHSELVRPEFVPYEHLRRHTKRFPWGKGDKSLFYNPKVNALSDGYEDERKDDLECCPDD